MAAGRTITVFLDADTRNAQQGIDGFGDSLAKVAKAGAALFAGSEVVSWLVDATKAAADAEASQTRYADALARTGLGAAVTELQDYNSELSKATGYDDDLIADAGAILSRFTSDKEALKAAEAAALDYATATGKDIPAAADAIAKASMGSTRALKALGIDYTATGDRATDFANVVDLINQKVGGTASMDTSAKALRSLETTYGDLQEKVGTVFLPMLDDIAEGFSQMVDAVGPALDSLDTLSRGFDTLRDAIDGLQLPGSDWLPDWLAEIGQGAGQLQMISQMFGPFASGVYMAQDAIDAQTAALEAAGYTIDEATGQIVALDRAEADAIPTVDDLTDSVSEQTSAARNAIDATIAWKQSMKEAERAARDNRDALNRQETGFNLNTKAGQQAAGAMNDVAAKTEAAWKAATDEGKHGRAQAILAEGRESLVRTGVRYGLTKQAANEYADRILAIPDDTYTKAVFDSAAAEAAAARFKERLDAILAVVTGSIRSSSYWAPASAAPDAPGRVAPITINVSAGIGDPVAIGRAIDRTLATHAYRAGRSFP